MKKDRQSMILDLVAEEEIGTQDELIERLRAVSYTHLTLPTRMAV